MDNTGMPPAVSSAPVLLSTAPASTIDVDLLVVPWFEADGPTALPSVDHATGGELARALATSEFRASPFDLLVTPVSDRSWKPPRIGFIGAGHIGSFDAGLARRIATAAALAARQRRVAHLGYMLRPGLAAASGDVDVAAYVQAVTEGLTLAEFTGATYKRGDPPPAPPPRVTIVVPEVADTAPDSPRRLEAALSRGRIMGECSNLARELANEPGNTLTPREFAARAAALASEVGVGVEILDEKQIEKLGMGLLLGVARGSSEPPRLIVFRHDPPGATGPVLGLVGKGITFDTGGISIKPADGMERMKDDMAGGAAVACAMRAIALLKAPIRVVGVVPTTENMPGGRAMKPGDVLTGASGKTVEVINTDAEGRLILGDGLWYAQQLGATHLVDVATLTGACVVGLGKAASGLFGRPDSWRDLIRDVGLRAGDRCWPMPIYDEYFDQIRSEIADMINSGGRAGGACTAAVFLKEFAGTGPWAHLDIAGTAWAEESKPFQPKGPIGIAVRTLAELPFTYERW